MANIFIPIEEMPLIDGRCKIFLTVSVMHKDKLIISLTSFKNSFVLESSFKSKEQTIDSITDSDGQIKILHPDVKVATIIEGHITVKEFDDIVEIGELKK